ncbi:MAG: hypothetical protein Q7S40_03530 [Opitutaceae bacterium]|nr:hypothetical protein [Opitutaceae bacterium]
MTKYTLSASLSGKLDKAKGTIRGISLISEGPAKGHGVDIDTKTLSEIFALTSGKVVKAYWTHGGLFDGDRLGEEVGLFSAFHIDGKELRAHFQVLEAFRTTFPTRYAYLCEMTEKAPANFGISLHFKGEPVWVLDTGAEVPADSGERPANAVGLNANDIKPRVRVFEVVSADFVSEPASGDGLFQRGKITELLDTKTKLSADVAEMVTKLAANTEQLAAKDTALTAKDATIADITAKLVEATKTLETDRTTFTTEKTALDAKVTELSGQVTTLSAGAEAAKNEAVTKESEYKTQVEALNRRLIEFGAIPVNIYSEVIDHRATFAAITDPEEKTRYWKKYSAQIMAS